MASSSENGGFPPGSVGARLNAWLCAVLGYAVLAVSFAAAISLLTWNIADPSFTHATSGPTRNALGPVGAIFSDLVMQLLGLAGVFAILPPVFWALEMIGRGKLESARARLMLAPLAVVLLACASSALPKVAGWPLPYNMGGLIGDVALRAATSILAMIRPERASAAAGLFALAGGIIALMAALGLSQRDLKLIFKRPKGINMQFLARAWQRLGEMSEPAAATVRHEPTLAVPSQVYGGVPAYQPAAEPVFGPIVRGRPQPMPQRDFPAPAQPPLPLGEEDSDPDFDRIVTICAPRQGTVPADTEDRGHGHRPGAMHAPEHRQPARAGGPSADPVRDAQRVMAQPRAVERHPMTHSAPSYPERVQQAPPQHQARRSPPAEMVPPPQAWPPASPPGSDDLYGRAVAIVLGDRKASADYLQHRLAIGYMRAADLIERMEREGILGAPVYNGMRPILIGGPGSREI
jgi:DNA segregation ATPase FtsK/SpoIIIE-like protein